MKRFLTILLAASMILSTFVTAIIDVAATTTSTVADAEELYLSDITPTSWKILDGCTPGYNVYYEDGTPLLLAGVTYDKGLSTHPGGGFDAEFVYDISGYDYTTFTAIVGKTDRYVAALPRSVTTFCVYVDGVLADEIIGLCLVHDLEHHASALGQAGNGAPFPTKVFEHGLHIDRLDVLELLAGKVCLEDPQRVLVTFLCGRHDVVLVIFKPHIGPICEIIDRVNIQAFCLGALVRLGFFFDFFLSLCVKTFVFASSVTLEAYHQCQLPNAVWTLAKTSFAVRPFPCHVYSFLWHRRFAILL